MDSTVAILFELIFSGAALAFGIWQLRQVRRLQRHRKQGDSDPQSSKGGSSHA